MIIRMETEGFQIWATVFDLGNKTLQKQLKFKDGVHWFPNPYDPSRKVYLFPDVPHMLKLLRNHCFDNGFEIPASDGKRIMDGPPVQLNKDHFQELVEKNEIKVAFKLTQFHIDVQSSERQRVRPAAQTFSHSVACAMIYGKSPHDPDYHNALTRSYFIQVVNDWFDVMNSRFVGDFRNKLKVPLGYNEDCTREQLDALGKMEEVLKKLKVHSTGHQDWIKGILANIHSTIALYRDLVINGPFKYVITSRVNQDALENVFSQGRALGGNHNTHPGPQDWLNRITKIYVCANFDVVVDVKNAAVKMEENHPSIECAPDDKDNVKDPSHESLSQEICRKLTAGNTTDLDVPIGVDDEDEDDITPAGTNSNARKWDKSYQGLTYIAGRVARKFMPKYPHLGKKTAEKAFHDDVGIYSWLYSVSKGGLILPDDDFMKDIEKFEDLFNDYHGPDINRESRVLDKFAKILKEHFGSKYDEQIYFFFAKARTHIRMKFMSHEVRRKKAERLAAKKLKMLTHRTYKQLAQHST